VRSLEAVGFTVFGTVVNDVEAAKGGFYGYSYGDSYRA
jgi:hypothetical protein